VSVCVGAHEAYKTYKSYTVKMNTSYRKESDLFILPTAVLIGPMLLTNERIQSSRQQIQQAVEAALLKKNVSARKASLDVVGNDGLIRDIRAGVIPSADRLQALFEYLGLEFYFGPVRENAVAPPAASRSEFAKVPLHEAFLSAGNGTANGHEEVIEHLAFRRDWLKKIGVSASAARLARVIGDSMEPTICADDMVLIDTKRNAPPAKDRPPTDRRPSPIYALITNGEARIKRIERAGAEELLLISDNKMHPTERVHFGDVALIGRVAWWGHTNRE
jgi:phage repressor protein C with HTH and peptisase S24 domain